MRMASQDGTIDVDWKDVQRGRCWLTKHWLRHKSVVQLVEVESKARKQGTSICMVFSFDPTLRYEATLQNCGGFPCVFSSNLRRWESVLQNGGPPNWVGFSTVFL